MVGFELPTMIAFLLFCIGLVFIFADSMVACWKKSAKRPPAVHRDRLHQNRLR